jgi:hypothetical protein
LRAAGYSPSWLLLTIISISLFGCSTLTPWRGRSALEEIDHIFAACAKQHQNNQLARWEATARCGNDGARSILAQSPSPYADLIEAALASRLAIARQIDAGAIPEEEGKAKLAALDAHIHALPGSTMDLLSTTAAVNPR